MPFCAEAKPSSCSQVAHLVWKLGKAIKDSSNADVLMGRCMLSGATGRVVHVQVVAVAIAVRDQDQQAAYMLNKLYFGEQGLYKAASLPSWSQCSLLWEVLPGGCFAVWGIRLCLP